ncbi:serine/threonine protein kinase [Xylogone sp. PMI_703]|nr:serine/threonine protein kinase [Xylogone sp. PMI_703]
MFLVHYLQTQLLSLISYAMSLVLNQLSWPFLIPQERLSQSKENLTHDASNTAQLDKQKEYLQHPISITYRFVRPIPGVELPQPRPGEVIYITKGEFLARGGTAFVERSLSGEVIKTPIPNPFSPREEEEYRRNMRLEAQIYQKIGPHPRIPQLVNWDPETCCLTIAYMNNGNLREYIRQNHNGITPELRIKWAKQAAEGLQILHTSEIVHCDISPRNFLLDSNLDVKICDFAGAAMFGSTSSVCPATRFRSPDFDYEGLPDYRYDIFSFGSLLYFIWTGKFPYEEILSDEVERLYAQQEFPDVSHLLFGKIIEECWHQEVDMSQIYDSISSIDG